MRVFSIINCVSEKNLSVLAMKNEFLYPIMLLYDIRKTYVGIIAAQEGNILKTPAPDIKGQTLKGSMFCEKTPVSLLKNSHNRGCVIQEHARQTIGRRTYS